MIMARGTKLSVFDEPEAGIDLWSFSNLIQVFEHLHEKINGSILIISHQERILEIADEIIVLADGKVVRQGPRDEILSGLVCGGGRCAFCTKEPDAMNKITQMLMEIVSELSGKPAGAYNIREDGQCAGRQSTDHIRITPKTSEPGIDIRDPARNNRGICLYSGLYHTCRT